MRISPWQLALAAALAAAPRTASAVDIWASDCNFDFQDVYNAGDAVCVTGELDVVPPQGICAEAYVIVTPTGSANPFWDITGQGGIPSANYILGCAGAGAFFDEYVWLPELVPGQYDLVIDQFPFFGGFGAEDLRVEQAFIVSNAPVVWSVDTQAIKDAAVAGLAQGQAMKNLVLALTAIDTLSTAADWAGAFGAGGFWAGIGLGVVCYATNADCPTSYNSAVITIGNKIIGHMGDALLLHYGAIIADPPDAMFQDVVPLRFDDVAANGGPFVPMSSAPLPRAQIAVATALATQAAAYQALLPTLEKFQGAELAGSHEGRLIQAEKLALYASIAIEAGDVMLAELDGLEAELAAAGTLDVEHDAAGMAAAFAAGPTDAERNLILSFGFSEDDIAAGVAAAGELEVPGPASWQAVIDAARGTFEAMRPTLADTVVDAQTVRDENAPYVLRASPIAELTAPATGIVGTSIALQAQASHLDPDAQLTLAWDLDGDGDFDDGTGPSVDFVPTAPGLVAVAVEASDGGRRDFAVEMIAVDVGNGAPELVSVTPTDYPYAAAGDVIELAAEAMDPDGDPLTFAWTVDGEPAGDGAALMFEMPDQEAHAVRVVVSDDDPYSPDAGFTLWVRSSIWQDGATGGVDDTGGNSEGATEGGSGDSVDEGSAAGPDGSGESGSGGTGSAGAGERDGGCGCTTGTRSPLAGLALPWLVLLGRRRRAERRPSR